MSAHRSVFLRDSSSSKPLAMHPAFAFPQIVSASAEAFRRIGFFWVNDGADHNFEPSRGARWEGCGWAKRQSRQSRSIVHGTIACYMFFIFCLLRCVSLILRICRRWSNDLRYEYTDPPRRMAAVANTTGRAIFQLGNKEG